MPNSSARHIEVLIQGGPASFSRTCSDTLLGGDIATQENYRVVTDTLLGGDVATASITSAGRTASDTLLGGDDVLGVLITANPLIFAPVESNLDVPGWTLSFPQPLVFKPVDQEAHVPGWFLYVDDPLAEPMTADVFDAIEYLDDPLGAVPLTTLGLEEDRAWEWLDVYSDIGSGSITLPADDDEMIFLDTDDLLVVAFNMYGMRVFSMLIEDDDAVDISDDDEIDEATRFNGRGAGVFLELGIIDPTGGPYRSPIEEDRHWGWPDSGFDHSTWVPVEVLGDIQGVINYAAVGIAGFGPDLPYWLDTIGLTVDRLWPVRDSIVVYAPGASLNGAFEQVAGKTYIYEEFTIAAGGDYILKVMMDDRGVTYVDGQQVGTINGINFFGVMEVAVTLSAGTHSIASVVENQEDLDGTGLGSGKYAWIIYEENTDLESYLAAVAASLFGTPTVVTPPTIVAQGSGAAVCLPFPAEVPGQSITKTIRYVIEEAQGRGYLPFGITLGFTDTTYSDGRTVTTLPDLATKVGQSVLGFLNELAQTYIDWELDPATLVLNVWQKGTQGRASSAMFDLAADQGLAGEVEAVFANIVSQRRKRERRKVSRLLVKWPGGWAEGFGASGGGEAPLELGAAQSIEEIDRLVAGEILTFNNSRVQKDVGIVPEQSSDAPYLGFRKADTVNNRGDTEQVQQIQVSTNSENPEDPDIVVTTLDIVLSAEERQARDLRNLL